MNNTCDYQYKYAKYKNKYISKKIGGNNNTASSIFYNFMKILKDKHQLQYLLKDPKLLEIYSEPTFHNIYSEIKTYAIFKRKQLMDPSVAVFYNIFSQQQNSISKLPENNIGDIKFFVGSILNLSKFGNDFAEDILKTYMGLKYTMAIYAMQQNEEIYKQIKAHNIGHIIENLHMVSAIIIKHLVSGNISGNIYTLRMHLLLYIYYYALNEQQGETYITNFIEQKTNGTFKMLFINDIIKLARVFKTKKDINIQALYSYLTENIQYLNYIINYIENPYITTLLWDNNYEFFKKNIYNLNEYMSNQFKIIPVMNVEDEINYVAYKIYMNYNDHKQVLDISYDKIYLLSYPFFYEHTPDHDMYIHLQNNPIIHNICQNSSTKHIYKEMMNNNAAFMDHKNIFDAFNKIEEILLGIHLSQMKQMFGYRDSERKKQIMNGVKEIVNSIQRNNKIPANLLINLFSSMIDKVVSYCKNKKKADINDLVFDIFEYFQFDKKENFENIKMWDYVLIDKNNGNGIINNLNDNDIIYSIKENKRYSGIYAKNNYRKLFDSGSNSGIRILYIERQLIYCLMHIILYNMIFKLCSQ